MSIEEKCTDETLSGLAAAGISQLFGRYNYSARDDQKELREQVVLNHEVLEDHYDSMVESGVLSAVFSTADTVGVDLVNQPFWGTKIRTLANGALTGKVTPAQLLRGECDDVLFAAKIIDDFNWTALFHAISSVQDKENYLHRHYPMVAEKFSESNIMGFKLHVDNALLSGKGGRPKCAVRGTLYKLYVKNGFLTKKSARKMRSDGAEESSLCALKTLTSNLDLYSNSDELLLQFTDSKYEGVIVHLVDNLPEYLLASVMGTEFYWAKRKLEDRLESIEARKSQEPPEGSATEGTY